MDTHRTNQKHYWSIINRVVGKKNQPINEITINGIKTSAEGNEELVANTFNTYFNECVSTLLRCSGFTTQSSSSIVSPHSHPNSFAFYGFTHEDVRDSILSIPNKVSFGSDKISITLVKENIDYFLRPLTFLFNESMKAGQFPEILKLGMITPIYKNGDKSSVSNYRPICILPTFSKIFEKCVKKIMLNYLQHTNYFSANQFGFLPGKGTDDALFHHNSYITENLEEGRSVVSVYFDRSASLSGSALHLDISQLLFSFNFNLPINHNFLILNNL